MNPNQKRNLIYLLILSMAGLLFLLSQIPRTEFWLTFGVFSVVFIEMLGIYYLSEKRINWKFILWTGVILRLSVCVFSPQWSDDVYRFLWDGELLGNGQNPYLQTPRQWQDEYASPDQAYLNLLFENLNSPNYYSVYPPLNQAIFWIGAKVSAGFVWNGFLGLRLILILAEIGVFYLLLKLLQAFKKSERFILLYWFNPLIILEIAGNFHFEGLVLFFLLACLYVLYKGKVTPSGGFFGLAIGMKLVPLMLAPTFLLLPQTKKNWGFYLVVTLVCILSFAWIFIDQSYLKFFQSLQLYQGKFEFNASIYYLLREIGFWIKGYNTIGTLTKILSASTLLLILYFSWKRRPKSLLELTDLWVLIYLTYLLLQPIIHPWYIIPALGLSLLTGRFMFLAWSFAVIFSYQAYGNVDFKENPLFLLIEYIIVFAAIYLDYVIPKRKSTFEA